MEQILHVFVCLFTENHSMLMAAALFFASVETLIKIGADVRHYAVEPERLKTVKEILIAATFENWKWKVKTPQPKRLDADTKRINNN